MNGWRLLRRVEEPLFRDLVDELIVNWREN